MKASLTHRHPEALAKAPRDRDGPFIYANPKGRITVANHFRRRRHSRYLWQYGDERRRDRADRWRAYPVKLHHGAAAASHVGPIRKPRRD